MGDQRALHKLSGMSRSRSRPSYVHFVLRLSIVTLSIQLPFHHSAISLCALLSPQHGWPTSSSNALAPPTAANGR